ncbi:MAG: hypothetical protein KF784_04120 [Fimbriimonadaceae bacterium]|nr:hypothetical protein [Fimbriimonadaceae bacterium]
MAYYMRFFSESSLPALSEIQAAFTTVNKEYSLTTEEPFVLSFGECEIAVLEISCPGDEVFEEEIEEFLESLEGSFFKRRRVEKCLKNCAGILAVQVLFGGKDSNETLDRIAPLWHFLMKRSKGLIQADGEGFYAGTKLILELE